MTRAEEEEEEEKEAVPAAARDAPMEAPAAFPMSETEESNAAGRHHLSKTDSPSKRKGIITTLHRVHRLMSSEVLTSLPLDGAITRVHVVIFGAAQTLPISGGYVGR